MSELIKSQNVFIGGKFRPATLEIDGGTITQVHSELKEGAQDYGVLHLIPGLIDCHVHINEPGRTEWEGFETATQAAAAGGITTLIDMPLNSSPVTTSLDAFQKKLDSTQGKLHVNCGFWGGALPTNLKELRPLMEAGVFGFKSFMVHSGIDEFPMVRPEELSEIMALLSESGGQLLLHAEMDPGKANDQGAASEYLDFLKTRGPEWELKAIETIIALSEKTGCRSHIVHLSAASALSMIKQAKEDGIPLSSETCPHYLVFCAEEIESNDTRFKCMPPIRERSNRETLWQGLLCGEIDFVVSDHSPCIPELKRGDFLKAWGGVSSLQFGLSSVLSQARDRGADLAQVVHWMAEKTASFLGLKNKGEIAVGKDADLVVFGPEIEYAPNSSEIYHRNKLTPFEGLSMKGKVLETRVGGRLAFREGEFESPSGEILLKGKNA